MRVCIVGGGKVGFYLAKTLHEHGHRPLLIEKNTETCHQIADWLDLPVVHGDGTMPEVLEGADLAGCQALVAVTGRDENNLIACQLAKRMFKVKKTVARINNPKNALVLKTLGVDIAISSTDSLARIIEREVETSAINQLLTLADGNTTLTEVIVPENFPFHGMTLRDIETVPDSIVISVTHDGALAIPHGNTRLFRGDKVMVLAKNESFRMLVKRWRLAEDKR